MNETKDDEMEEEAVGLFWNGIHLRRWPPAHNPQINKLNEPHLFCFIEFISLIQFHKERLLFMSLFDLLGIELN